MTKSILLTVSPTEALNVLNGKQLALLRKRVPKGYVGWCYGVVSKGKPYLNKEDVGNKYFLVNGVKYMGYEVLNSKIPFKFWYEEVYIDNYRDVNSNLYAISITKLEVFDKPMELGDFNRMYISRTMDNVKTGLMLTLTKSPSTYQYVWVKE